MGRIIRIVIYAVIIIAVYFLVMEMLNHYYKNKKESDLVRVSAVNDTIINEQDTAILEDDAQLDTFGLIKSEEIVSGVIDYKEVDKKTKSLEEKKTSNNTTKPAIKPKVETIKSIPETVTTSSSGLYSVVAGSYLIKENANKMVQSLKTKGFESAKIVVFPASEYHTVVVSSHKTRQEAELVLNSLKSKGIDSFIKVKS
ncbi:MAG: SPOR domain-containing protein [Lewinellaceae bacterium]|nr:SPOR domain-containing protein [Lewinellaceae bacterium]